MPLRETATATCSRRVLRDKNGVAAKRRLLAVVWRSRRRKPASDEFVRVLDDLRQALFAQISLLARAQPEAHSKIRMPECIENRVEIAHRHTAFRPSDTTMNPQNLPH